MLWMIVHLLQVIDQRLVWQKQGRKNLAKMPKWRDFPWSTETNDKSTKKLGDRGDLSNEQVEAWLESIRPPRKTDT